MVTLQARCYTGANNENSVELRQHVIILADAAARDAHTLHNEGESRSGGNAYLLPSLRTLRRPGRLDPLQAAVLRVKLRCLDEWNERRSAVAMAYMNQLAETSLKLPKILPDTIPVWHLFVIRHAQRDALQQYLHSCGIETMIHYPLPPHLQPCYGEFKTCDLPVTERLANEILSLPMFPFLLLTQVEDVARTVARFNEHAS